MVMDKTPIYGFPTPAYDYGDGGEVTAVAEFTSSMSAAASAVLFAIDTISNALSLETGNMVSADTVLSNNISVVSLQLTSVSVVLQGGINVISNTLSNVTSNRVSAVSVVSVAAAVISNNLNVEVLARQVADDVLSNQLSILSNQVSGLSQQVSMINAAVAIKAMNTAAQASVSASVPVTVSGVSLPIVSGSNYYFRFIIPYTHKNLAGGVTIGVTGPAMTSFVARAAIPTGGTALATVYTYGTIGAINTNISNISNALSGVTLPAYIEGYANPSESGSLHCVIGITVAGVQATLRILLGAMGQAWKLS